MSPDLMSNDRFKLQIDRPPMRAPASQHDAPNYLHQLTLPAVMEPTSVSVTADAKLGDAAGHFMRSNQKHLPVIDATGFPVGVLSDTDVPLARRANALFRGVVEKTQTEEKPIMDDHQWQTRRVRDVMTPNIISVSAQTSLANAIRIVQTMHVDFLIAMEPKRRAAGVIPSSILNHLMADLPESPVRIQQVKPPPIIHAPKPPVLIVEDDPAVAEALIDILHEESYPVLHAINGFQALDILTRTDPQPGLILLDLLMPKMDGWRFREVQLANRQLKEIPVVAMSAHIARWGEHEIPVAQTFLPKPLDLVRLLEAVRTHYRLPN